MQKKLWIDLNVLTFLKILQQLGKNQIFITMFVNDFSTLKKWLLKRSKRTSMEGNLKFPRIISYLIMD